MKVMKATLAVTIGALLGTSALARDVDDFLQRNARQQQRIEHGLRNGDLSVREAAGLEQHAAQIERYQSRALADGAVSLDEARRIDRMQDRFGHAIGRQARDADRGAPDAHSTRRMANDIARSENQQRRIAAGVRSGDLTNREAARLVRGQSNVDRRQGYAGADGFIDRHEQYGARRAHGYQNRSIWRERSDGQHPGSYARDWRHRGQ